MKYVQCKHCDHFIEENEANGVPGLAPYIHNDDGEQEYDHDAEPGERKTMTQWQKDRPDLFKEHPDGAIGPNSAFYSQRGKD